MGNKYIIKNGKAIIGDKIENIDILIADGKIIDAAHPKDYETPDYKIIDAQGSYVSAGFVDIHIHGGGGSDFMDDDDDAYFNIVNAHLRHGTTSLMPTTLSADYECIIKAIKKYKQAKADKRISGCLIGLHLEGPYLSPFQAGAQKPENIRDFEPKEYNAIIDAAEGDIKRWSVAPELKGSWEFAKTAQKNNITLSIAHSNADFDTVLEAFEHGYRHITHLYSGMSGITRIKGFRVAGVLEAAYYLDDMNVEIIADGCHLPHSLLKYVVKFKDISKIAIITDAMRAAGQDVKESYLGSKDDPQPVIIEDGVAKLLSREAFGGSVATADRLVRTMKAAGVRLQDCVKMATSNPIAMMNLPDKKGKIQKGYDADICIFDEDINIIQVIKSGHPIL